VPVRQNFVTLGFHSILRAPIEKELFDGDEVREFGSAELRISAGFTPGMGCAKETWSFPQFAWKTSHHLSRSLSMYIQAASGLEWWVFNHVGTDGAISIATRWIWLGGTLIPA
jgi:hypothetical protein